MLMSVELLSEGFCCCCFCVPGTVEYYHFCKVVVYFVIFQFFNNLKVVLYQFFPLGLTHICIFQFLGFWAPCKISF